MQALDYSQILQVWVLAQNVYSKKALKEKRKEKEEDEEKDK